MKIITHYGWGGYSIPDQAMEELGIDKYRQWDESLRTDSRLVEWVENHQDEDSEEGLCITEIPDEATDWRIIDYDGQEDVLYVVDGKMY